MERSEIERQLEELHPASWGWALSCCHRNRDQAEEVLQMTYLKVIEGKASFDGRSRFKTWLFAVIRKTALEQWRWRGARQRWMNSFSQRAVESQGEEADLAFERGQRNQRLIAALSRLARRQREVLELVFYHEMTIEEAAETLGISLGSARVHYERGKKKMKEALS